MMYAKTWYQGSYTRLISKDIDFSSQRISDFLKAIGEEHFKREYFKNHISLLAKTNEGIIIDATSMPNIKSSFALVDVEFYSEDNIKELYTKKVDFLTRLLSRRTLYKDLIKETVPDIETFKNAVKYVDRILFVEQKK